MSCRRDRRNWRPDSVPNSRRCATAPMPPRACAPSRRGANRGTRAAEASGSEHLLVASELFHPGRFPGLVVIAQRSPIRLGYAAAGRDDTYGRTTGYALFTEKIGNRRRILGICLGHLRLPFWLSTEALSNAQLVNDGLEQKKSQKRGTKTRLRSRAFADCL